LLELVGVSKSFGDLQALKPLTLNIQLGQTTVLIGPSGCGKSTLLRIMIGIISPDRGEVKLDGEAVAPSNFLSVRQKMGYVIQDGGLFPHLTARGNATLMAHYLRWDDEKIRERLEALADLTQFPADGLDRFPAQLSGGQRQRVSLMRALMLDPEVLLLDEPLGALDPMIRSELQEDLRRIFQRVKKTVIMVTHDIGEAGFFGDTIFLMREGEILQRGNLEALVRQPADSFVTRFINAQRSPLETLGESDAAGQNQ
jgi:osmoprotectant transport system ATP-binding protein